MSNGAPKSNGYSKSSEKLERKRSKLLKRNIELESSSNGPRKKKSEVESNNSKVERGSNGLVPLSAFNEERSVPFVTDS